MSTLKKIKKIIKSLDKCSPWPLLYAFIMTKNEKKLFDKKIKNSKTYLEFGLGGSTIRVLEKSKAKIYCVESSHEWISLMREYNIIERGEKKRLIINHVDIGPTHEWGYPESDKFKEYFPAYSSDIFNIVKCETLDLVLVDGRFRVACALKLILECNNNHSLQILIHDFWKRERYHILLKYLDVVEKVDTLGLFVIKNSVDLNLVEADYQIYKFIPE